MKDAINKSLEVLKNGGLILYPTETVWGLGCDPTNKKAVERVYHIKKKDPSKSLMLLVDHEGRIPSYVDQVPDIAWDLLDVADQPLTLIYPGAKHLSENLVAADGSVGIRITQDAFCQQLISRFRKPLVSASANISGEQAPECFMDIDEEIKGQVDYVVEWRQNGKPRNTKAPSIIKLGSGGQVQVIRK